MKAVNCGMIVRCYLMVLLALGAMVAHGQNKTVINIGEGSGSGSAGGLDSIEWKFAALADDVVLNTSDTWYDGPSISLGAGTWLVNAHGSFMRNDVDSSQVYMRITDGSNHFASTGQVLKNPHAVPTINMALTTIIQLASTTTVKIQMLTSNGGLVRWMLDGLINNDSGDNATQITAIKLSQ